MKRMRISTLMLFIVIAALSVGLVVEKRRSARMLAQVSAERDSARMQAERAAYVAQIERLSSLQLQAKAKTHGANPNTTAPPSR